MSCLDAYDYMESMCKIKAQEFLEQIQISTWPKMNENDRKKIYKQKIKEAGIGIKRRAATAQDIARIIGT